VVLTPVDQRYDTRQRLLSLAAAVAAQDEDIQAAIIAAMEPNSESSLDEVTHHRMIVRNKAPQKIARSSTAAAVDLFDVKAQVSINGFRYSVQSLGLLVQQSIDLEAGGYLILNIQPLPVGSA
jgi:hypothetical protein